MSTGGTQEVDNKFFVPYAFKNQNYKILLSLNNSSVFRWQQPCGSLPVFFPGMLGFCLPVTLLRMPRAFASVSFDSAPSPRASWFLSTLPYCEGTQQTTGLIFVSTVLLFFPLFETWSHARSQPALDLWLLPHLLSAGFTTVSYCVAFTWSLRLTQALLHAREAFYQRSYIPRYATTFEGQVVDCVGQCLPVTHASTLLDAGYHVPFWVVRRAGS